MQFNQIVGHFQHTASELVDEKNTFIQFTMCDSHYALDIHQVNEIVEIPVITPYPEKVSGYLGIVNLSGQVLPVLDYTGEHASLLNVSHLKNSHLLLVADFKEESPFCLIIKHPKRVEVAKKLLDSSNVNINGLPVRILCQSDFSFKENAS